MKKGFTLVELLIVIGILAVLSTATVLILNPAQILQESRDTQRLNDLNSMVSSISLLLATQATPDLDGAATFTCGTNFGAGIAGATDAFATATTLHAGSAGVRAVDGTGWMRAVLSGSSGVPGGSPLAVLPQDPTNAITPDQFNYQYSCNNTGSNRLFELNANMESAKYQGYEANAWDGGDAATTYEVGNSLTL